MICRKSIRFLALLLLTAATPLIAFTQGIVWERQVHARLENVQMAFYHGGLDYSKPRIADLDNDGDGDLYVGEHDGFVNVFLNLGGNPPNWQCVTTALDSIDVGKHAAPTFWDVDNDGDLDLFIGNEDGVIAYYRNDGTPSAPLWTLVTETYANLRVDHHAIPFFRDVDADGKDDLLIGNNSGGAVFIKNVGQPGNPRWRFQTSFYQGINLTMKSSVCVYDLNGDNLQDLIMSALQGNIYYYKNLGPAPSPSYISQGIVGSVSHNGTPAFWDLNNDGDLDMISGESDGNVDLWTNTGNASSPRFELTTKTLAYLDLGLDTHPTLGDLDNDGDLDMVVGRQRWGMTYFENVGAPDSAAWHRVSDSYTGVNLFKTDTPCLVNIDNDADFDLIVGCGDGTLTYIKNNGTAQNPVWAPPINNYTGVDVGTCSTPAFADLDGDGDLDMFVGSEAGTVRYIRRVGTPTNPVWQDLGNLPGIDVGTLSTPSFVDIDSDGDVDMVIGCGGITGWLNLYINIGGPFQPGWATPISPWNGWDFGDNSAPIFADLNNDGNQDLLVGCQSGGLYLYNNLGPLHDIDITLVPMNPPIQIPRTGGSFSYEIHVTNGDDPFTGQLWTNILMPDSSVFGPTLGPLNVSLPPGGSLNLTRNQIVWSTAPAGFYLFKGYVGLYPDSMWSQDSFPFEKTNTGNGPLVVNDWQSDSKPLGDWSGIATTPSAFGLHSPIPNPFNPSTKLSFTLPVDEEVSLEIVDVRGCRIATLSQGWYQAGDHNVTFDGVNLPSGIYLAHLKAGGSDSVQKLVLLK
jgi:hypothetical protein